MGALVDGARAAGVRWVALTEHTRPGTPPSRGWVEGVLLIPGFELRGGGGSILALGVERLPERSRDLSTQVQKIHELGGLAFVAHFEKWEAAALESYGAAQLDGLEIVNLHAVTREVGKLKLAARGLLLPRPLALRGLARAPSLNLERWRQVPEAHSIVGGLDVHAKIRVLGPMGGTVDPYGSMFRLLTTHVLVREITTVAILEALRLGRSYVAFETFGQVDRFVFELGPKTFHLEAPAEARLALICDGVEVDSECAVEADLKVPLHAAYCRAEAWKGDRLWVVTSEQRVPRASEGYGPRDSRRFRLPFRLPFALRRTPD